MSLRTLVSPIDKSRVYEYVDDGRPLRGGTKSVYFSPDKSYAVAFYQDELAAPARERLRSLVADWAPRIFGGATGDYFRALYAWPTDLVEREGRVGLVLPHFPAKFYLGEGYAGDPALAGALKESTLFMDAKRRNRRNPQRLAEPELGTWLSYFQLCVNLARSLRRLHSVGLAHADLSARNLLVDPASRGTLLTDIDELVLPDGPPPDVLGMSGYIAPELLLSRHLDFNDPKRRKPDVAANLHSLAVMIYGLLLHRHPLIGAQVIRQPDRGEWFHLGDNALYIEDPVNHANRPDIRAVDPFCLPWASVAKLPAGSTGPYLRLLFEQAFTEGLRKPAARPAAAQWEAALLRTTDLMLPCGNAVCDQKWYVYDNSLHPRCPFCGTAQSGTVPVLDLYHQTAPGTWKPADYRIVAHRGKAVSVWHVNPAIVRDERLSQEQKQPLALFDFAQGHWQLFNQKLDRLRDIDSGAEAAAGKGIPLRPGQKLLMSGAGDSMMAVVNLVNQH